MGLRASRAGSTDISKTSRSISSRDREVEFLTRKPARSESNVTVSQEDNSSHGVSQSPLCGLPYELLVEIMGYLSGQSLWSLRQSSTILLSIFEAKALQRFHGEAGLKDRYIPFSMDSVTGTEKNQVARFIRTDREDFVSENGTETGAGTESGSDTGVRYCSSCIEVQSRGERDFRMINMRKTRFCDGCKERHASIFFSPESIEKHDRGIGKLVCIGRAGKITLCSHDSHKPVTWQTIEQAIPKCGDLHRVSCTHRSHEPHPNRWRWKTTGSAFPRLLLARNSICREIQITLARVGI